MATETWVLNETLTISGSNIYNNIEMTYSGQQRIYPIKSLKIYEYSDGPMTSYAILGQESSTFDDVTTSYTLYDNTNGWNSYNGILYNVWTFSQPVTDSTLLAWLQANGTKQSAPKVTVDLTSLSGYESLPAGTYQLGVKAQAANYQDSDLSQTVSFTKLAAPVATASDTTVTWDGITNAESYDVYVDGELYENTTGGSSAYQVTVTNSNPDDIYNVEDISIYERDSIVPISSNSDYGTLLGTVTPKQTITVTVTKKYLYVINTYGGVSSYSGGLSKVEIENLTGIGADCFEVSANGTITATGYYCLTGDTLITLTDGSSKRIDQLTLNDKVLSYNPKTLQLEPDEITYTDATENKSFTEYDRWTFEDGSVVKTVHRHRFYNVERQAMVYMDEWKIGEHAITVDGKKIALVDHETISEEVHHYTIFTKNQNYFANGLLSGNRYTKSLSF